MSGISFKDALTLYCDLNGLPDVHIMEIKELRKGNDQTSIQNLQDQITEGNYVTNYYQSSRT